MRLCVACHRHEAYGPTSSYCRACHAAYIRQWQGPPRVRVLRPKALAWLRAAPRTSRQIADLLSITPQHAATMLYQMKRSGRIAATDDKPARYRAL